MALPEKPAKTDGWLVLKSFDGKPDRIHSSKPGFFIAIPKKVAPLAVTRNRVKRLIREAMRRETGAGAGRTYFFRVRSVPAPLNLKTVRQAVSDVVV